MIGRRSVPAVALALAMIGASIAGSALADTIDRPIALSTPRGFVLDGVRAVAEGPGVRFHGAVCRRAAGPAPRFVRADRLDRDGQVLSTASKVLWDLRGRERHCTVFDLPTASPPIDGEQFRVCLLSTNRPCPEPPSAPSGASDKATKGRP